jgi:hypothetical protein
MPAGHYLAQARVEVIVAALEAKEPCLVIDARDQEVHFVVGHAELARQHAGRVLHAVAEADSRDAETIQVPAAHRHRVGVVDQERLGAQLRHVDSQAAIDRRRAKKAEDVARPERVANRLVESIAARNLDIESIGIETANLEGDDNMRCAVQGTAAVGRGLDPGRIAMVIDQLAGGAGGALQPVGVDIHQGDGGVAQLGEAQQISHQAERKNVAAGANDCDLRHRSFLNLSVA